MTTPAPSSSIRQMRFAYACRAQAWGRKHDRDKQTADYTTAIELDPNNAVYRLFRASTWAIQGKHARAMEDYDEAVRLDPNNPEVYVYRGIERQKDLGERSGWEILQGPRRLRSSDRARPRIRHRVLATGPNLDRAARVWQGGPRIRDAYRAKFQPPAGTPGARLGPVELRRCTDTRRPASRQRGNPRLRPDPLERRKLPGHPRRRLRRDRRFPGCRQMGGPRDRGSPEIPSRRQ